MKISAGRLAQLRAAVEPIANGMGADGTIRSHYRRAGLSHQRYRWDCLHACGFDVATLYADGLKDPHIDTALREICGASYDERAR